MVETKIVVQIMQYLLFSLLTYSNMQYFLLLKELCNIYSSIISLTYGQVILVVGICLPYYFTWALGDFKALCCMYNS